MKIIQGFKVARFPVLLRSTNLESRQIEFFAFVKILAYSPLWESQTVHCPKTNNEHIGILYGHKKAVRQVR